MPKDETPQQVQSVQPPTQITTLDLALKYINNPQEAISDAFSILSRNFEIIQADLNTKTQEIDELTKKTVLLEARIDELTKKVKK